jgi:hypothetical protein
LGEAYTQAGEDGLLASDNGVVQIDNYFTGDAWEFDYTGGLQHWIVPQAGEYDFTVIGASGGYDGGVPGGGPAAVIVEFALPAGAEFTFLVGGVGHNGTLGGTSTYSAGGGGGGTFVFLGSGVPEPAGWAMMLLGVGVLGANLRRRRAVAA